MVENTETTTRARAELSGGTSAEAIYELVRRVLELLDQTGGVVLDVGCGNGDLHGFIGQNFERYVGVDIIRYGAFPADCEFVEADFDGHVPLDADFADVVVSVETIEHLENPRHFVRELARLARPGGLVVITTPNQLSFLSKLTLVLKNQFNAFQDGSYPAHLTALLESDLVRIARETRLSEPQLYYSNSGRIPGTSLHWPRFMRGRAFSDNVLLVTTKPSI